MNSDLALDGADVTINRPSYLFVIPWDLNSPGGVNEVVTNLYRQMLMSGKIRPIIVVSKWENIHPIELSIDGCHTILMRFWSPLTREHCITGLVKWLITSPVYLMQMVKLCRRHRILAFNFHFPDLGAFGIALLRFLRLYKGALILSFHGLDLESARRGGRVEKALWKFVFHYSTAIVACSQAFALEVGLFVGKAGHIYTIRNGLDVDHFLGNINRSSELLAALGSRKFVLSVATWEDKKGLDIVVRAFSVIREKYRDLALVLVGRSAGATRSLQQLVCELQLNEHVFFFENVSHNQVGLFFEKATAFCLPSRAEPFGIVILEAGACRLPVVATRVGGIPEIIIDGESGILVGVDDVEGLVSKLDQILSDTALAYTLGEALYQRVLSEFSWLRAYNEYCALLPRL